MSIVDVTSVEADLEHSGPPAARSDTRSAWAFLVPFMIVYVLFLLWPVVQAVIMGFYDWDFLDPDARTFEGLRNYGRMFWGDGLVWDVTHQWAWRLAGLLLLVPTVRATRSGRVSRGTAAVLVLLILGVFAVAMGIHPGSEGRWYDTQFWGSFGNTLLFTVMSTPPIVILGLGLALALNRPGRLQSFLRSLFFAPYVLSVAVLTLIWAFLLNPNQGLIAAVWEFFGAEPIAWLNSTTWAMPAIVVTTLWWTVGFNLVLFLAGLQDIDGTQYEAATIDGANRWDTFRYITLPGLSRTIVLVVTLQVIASFQIFGQVFIMTGGGPNGATRVAIQHIYETGFRDFELGYSSAMSLFLFVVMVGISVLQFRLIPDED